MQLSFNILRKSLAYNKSKLHKIFGYRSKRLNFGILERGLAIVSPPHFVYDFSRELFLMLYYIDCPSFTA